MGSAQEVVVIPAFNEAGTIDTVVKAVRHYADVIVVDDGSTDDTSSSAKAAGAIVVSHSINQGYEAALDSGFREASKRGYEYVVTFDADGQHNAGILPEFFDALKSSDLGMVLGVRPYKARVSEKLMGLYFNLRFGVDDILCGMKGYRICVYRDHGQFDSCHSIGGEIVMMALKRGYAFRQLPVPIAPRLGNSRFGSVLKGNAKILRAFGRLVIKDIATNRQRKHARC